MKRWNDHQHHHHRDHHRDDDDHERKIEWFALKIVWLWALGFNNHLLKWTERFKFFKLITKR